LNRFHASTLPRFHASTPVLPLLAAAVALALAGCAGYRLGPTNGLRASERTIQVNPFANQTMEPRLSEAVTHSLRKHLSQDGTYRLDTRDQGDIVVTGAIVELNRSSLSLQRTDVITPRDYYVVVTAQLTARERATGKVLVNRTVTGRSTLRVGNDLSSAERQAIPLVADDLARNATSLIVDGEW
jgi:hypothetical protein